MAIGQGDVALTPIGINTAIAALAQGGKLCFPKIYDTERKCIDLGIEENVIDTVREGMRLACSSGGTGYTFFDFKEKYGVNVACKTGTAETNDIDNTTHAWFTVFAPAEDKSEKKSESSKKPEIVLTVMVEKGGEGSKVAGPIAREIMDYWFGSK